ncbi:unnamed protein product, partial [Brugia pahangi]|uniref:Fructose-2,6-bisphosphatase n=1 Tax=Brugia pahangi TaxID=6280 RepID=A0A0N4T1I9_BRUPA
EIGKAVVVVRHGERCDFTFNQQGFVFQCQWEIPPIDLNLSRNLPKHKDGFEMFAYDTPLTEMGYLQSKLTGQALRDHGVKVDYVYCSAALRCVQTAVGVIKGLDSCTLRISVEPGLYEWMHWCRNELSRLGYPISSYYTPFLKPNELCVNETLNDFYERSFTLVRKILSIHNEGRVFIGKHIISFNLRVSGICFLKHLHITNSCHLQTFLLY